MFLLDILETIKVENGEVFNLKYHQKRFNKTRLELFQSKQIIDLSSIIKAPKKGLFRCRVVYSNHVKSVEYIPYIPKVICSLKVVPSNMSYDYKYLNRDELNLLLEQNSNFDEIIIEKNKYITDTTISNIALYSDKHKQWFTPAKPLLEGTMREKLLTSGFLQIKNIKSTDISSYKKIALINAMIGFKVINSPTIVC